MQHALANGMSLEKALANATSLAKALASFVQQAKYINWMPCIRTHNE
jgi:hypothetical protein